MEHFPGLVFDERGEQDREGERANGRPGEKGEEEEERERGVGWGDSLTLENSSSICRQIMRKKKKKPTKKPPPKSVFKSRGPSL